MSRRRVLGPNPYESHLRDFREAGSRLRDFREAKTVPGVGSRVNRDRGRPPYRTPRQRLRISTASFIGCREGASANRGSHRYRKSPSRLPRSRNRAGCREPSQGDRRARLSDAAPAASDKHRLLHRMSRSHLRGVPGVGRRRKSASRLPRSQNRRVPPSSASDKHRLLHRMSRSQTVARPLSKVTFATSAKPYRTGFGRVLHRKARPGPKPWLEPKPCRVSGAGDRRARLSDAAPAASDKHRLLHRMSRRAVLGPNRGSIPIESRLRDFRSRRVEPGARPPSARLSAPRQRLRISTASFIGCREGAAWAQTVARPLSKVAFATSAKPRPCRVSGAESRRSPGALIGRRASGFG